MVLANNSWIKHGSSFMKSGENLWGNNNNVTARKHKNRRSSRKHRSTRRNTRR
jgi:hypothetical protein